jgi:hypothetical protein
MQQALSQVASRRHFKIFRESTQLSLTGLTSDSISIDQMRNVICRCREIVSRAGAILIEDSHSGTVARTNHLISQPGPRIHHPFHANIHARHAACVQGTHDLSTGSTSILFPGQTMNYRAEFFPSIRAKLFLTFSPPITSRCLPED